MTVDLLDSSTLLVTNIGTITLSGNIEGVEFALAPGESVESSSTFLEVVVNQLLDIIAANPSTPLADKLEDANGNLQVALADLAQTPPDNQAAVGNIEGAVGDLEAAVNDGLLDSGEGTQLMDQLAGVARQLAASAVDQAIAQGSDPTIIADAQQALAEADTLRASGAFKDAISNYKDALAKAE